MDIPYPFVAAPDDYRLAVKLYIGSIAQRANGKGLADPRDVIKMLMTDLAEATADLEEK